MIAEAPAATDVEKAARKRRRRRGGKPVENGAEASASTPHGAAAAPAPKSARPVEGSAANKAVPSPSLLTRIGKGLKSLVTRAPRNQH